MKLSGFIVLALFASLASAQLPPRWFDPLPDLREFLQLTDAQIRTILSNNDDYNRWSAEKQMRIRQVQTEIVQETAKQVLEPNALGMRYAEIETICREMKERLEADRNRNLATLNMEQRAKLKVLEDAMKLAPAISQAQYGNLLGGFTYAPPVLTSSGNRIGIGGVIGGIVGGGVFGCYSPFPVGVGGVGDFTFTPGQAAQPRQSQ
jgi:hypothetical protein